MSPRSTNWNLGRQTSRSRRNVDSEILRGRQNEAMSYVACHDRITTLIKYNLNFSGRLNYRISSYPGAGTTKVHSYVLYYHIYPTEASSSCIVTSSSPGILLFKSASTRFSTRSILDCLLLGTSDECVWEAEHESWTWMEPMMLEESLGQNRGEEYEATPSTCSSCTQQHTSGVVIIMGWLDYIPPLKPFQLCFHCYPSLSWAPAQYRSRGGLHLQRWAQRWRERRWDQSLSTHSTGWGVSRQ